MWPFPSLWSMTQGLLSLGDFTFLCFTLCYSVKLSHWVIFIVSFLGNLISISTWRILPFQQKQPWKLLMTSAQSLTLPSRCAKQILLSAWNISLFFLLILKCFNNCIFRFQQGTSPSASCTWPSLCPWPPRVETSCCTWPEWTQMWVFSHICHQFWRLVSFWMGLRMIFGAPTGRFCQLRLQQLGWPSEGRLAEPHTDLLWGEPTTDR